ncbi:MAG: DUF3990 domain-containing protein [Thermoguttaceae bacterium]
MKTYHGSLEVVESPKLIVANRTLDFGQGFYTTTNFDQANQWVEIRKENSGSNCGYVNVYEVADSLLDDTSLNVLKFDSPNEEWVDFIIKNRTDVDFNHDFDLVFGPVANDRVYTSLTLFENGFIDKATLIIALKAHKLVDQLLFHTERAITFLNFKECVQI